MKSWEMTLESLRNQGWGYGYGRLFDGETGQESYLVSIRRGNERFRINKPTLEEAVTEIEALVQNMP